MARATSKNKAEQAVERDVKGRFRPGSTGNRRGRPTGAAAAVLQDLRQWAESEGLPKMKAAALKGDMDALKTLVVLALPKQKPVVIPSALPGGPGGVLSALEAGEIDPDTAKTAMDVYLTMARITELEEIEKRLTALEALQEKETRK